jgi:hypothetical protein
MITISNIYPHATLHNIMLLTSKLKVIRSIAQLFEVCEIMN